MKIKILSSSKENFVEEKENFDRFSGRVAWLCSTVTNLEELANEDVVKIEKKARIAKLGGYHMVFDHSCFTLYFEKIPRIIAMILNNEHLYSESKCMLNQNDLNLNDKESLIFNKWFEIFKNKISKFYKAENPQVFTENKIEKLALENASYLISVFAPVDVIYTTTYRQYNILVNLIEKTISQLPYDAFYARLKEGLIEFLQSMKELPYYDKDLSNIDNDRNLTIFATNKVEEYFGDVYAVNYHASFNEFALAQRHRSLNYNFKVLDNYYYIPNIIKDSEDLSSLWLDDLKILNNYPMATMLEINEMGTLDNFILKVKEKRKDKSQIEINDIINSIIKKYCHALQIKVHSRVEEIMKYLN